MFLSLRHLCLRKSADMKTRDIMQCKHLIVYYASTLLAMNNEKKNWYKWTCDIVSSSSYNRKHTPRFFFLFFAYRLLIPTKQFYLLSQIFSSFLFLFFPSIFMWVATDCRCWYIRTILSLYFFIYIYRCLRLLQHHQKIFLHKIKDHYSIKKMAFWTRQWI